MGAGPQFANDYKRFYCQAKDPIYIQEKKQDIIVNICKESNLTEVLNELGEYATDINYNLAKKSVLALGKLGTKFPDKNVPIIKQLTSYIKIAKSYLMDEVVISFSDILAVSKKNMPDILNQLESLAEQITSAESKISLIWIQGEYGSDQDASPYIIENIIDDITSKKDDESENEQNTLIPFIKLF